MAVVKNPALSVDAAGNVGGVQFSHWRGMHIAKEFAPGTQPNTGLQQAVQAKLNTVTSAWGSTLTDAERKAWSAFAKNQVWLTKLGDVYTPTGYMAFVKHNCIRQQMSLGILANPIVDDKVPNVRLIDVPNAGLGLIQVVRMLASENGGTPDYAEADKYEIFIAGPYDSPGRNATAGEWRLAGIVAEDNDFLSDTLTTGKYYWFKGRAMLNSGRVGNFFQKQVLVEWNPNTVNGLILWTTDDTGVSGDPVDQWDDQSDEGNHWQAAGGERPTIVGGEVNFDGVQQNMTNDNVAITSPMWQRTQDWTILAVLNITALTGLDHFISIINQVDAVSLGSILIADNIAIAAVTIDRMGIMVRDTSNNALNRIVTDNSLALPIGQNTLIGMRQQGGVIELFIDSDLNRAVILNNGNVQGAVFHNIGTLMGCRERAPGGKDSFLNTIAKELVIYNEAVSNADLGFLIDGLKIRHTIV